MKKKVLVAVCLLMVFCLLPVQGLALRVGVIARVTSPGTLNVRMGPGTDYGVVGIVKPGYIYVYLGTENGWNHIVYENGITGYISGNKSALEIGLVPDEYSYDLFAEAYVRITHTATLNIRSGPGKEYPVIAIANPQDAYPYMGPANGWYAVQLDDGQIGYVAANRSEVEMWGVYDDEGTFHYITLPELQALYMQ